MSDFYLNGLIYCCGAPMWPVVRRDSRRYRCARCGYGVDALVAEVTVWEKATKSAPALGHPLTPYAARASRLMRYVSRVTRAGDDFGIDWLALNSASRPPRAI